MITDKERREVAAKMRKTCRENPDVSLQGMVASTMNECLPEGMEYGPTLADLIDRPTCRIVYSAQLHSAFGEPIDGLKIYELSCEHQAIGPEKPEYCPKCGAAIVDEYRKG